MKRVGVREFRDHATRYLSQGEILAVERHGRPIGFFIPARASAEEDVRQALERLHRVVEQVLAQSGMTEDELSQALDLNQPAPDAAGD
jgi:antitoxin (DNA-binding transcriptional repressor) of toxin-antitoxin stability system